MQRAKNNWDLMPRPAWLAIAGVGVFGLVFLAWSHTAHVFSVIPYLILLACPLMHLFMHKNHGNHQDSKNNDGPKRDQHHHERQHLP